MSNETMILFGVHVPKCAGTTLLERVRLVLPEHQIYQNTSFAQNFWEDRPEFLHLYKKTTLRFVFGHYLHQEMLKLLPGPLFLFTGLREPVGRITSEMQYNARLRKDQNLSPIEQSDFFKLVENPMCWFFISRFPRFAGERGSPSERAIRVLKIFNLCYFTDTFECDTREIFGRLGITPPAESFNVGTEQQTPTIDASLARLDYDLELYAWAREHFSMNLDAHPADEVSEQTEAFRSEPLDLQALRGFLHSAAYNEYKNWGLLHAIIQGREQLIAESQSEIEFYKCNDTNQV